MHTPPNDEDSKRIAIIGAGNVGRTLGLSLVSKGWRVGFGVPEPAKYGSLVQHFGGRATVSNVAGVIAGSEVAILAVPFSAALQVARSVPDWAGCVLASRTWPTRTTAWAICSCRWPATTRPRAPR